MRSKQILPLLTVFALVAAMANAFEGDGSEKNLKKGQEDEDVQLNKRWSLFGNSHECSIWWRPRKNPCPAGHCIGNGYTNLTEAALSRFSDSDIIKFVKGWIPEWALSVMEQDAYIKQKSDSVFGKVPGSLNCSEACECYTGHPGSYKKLQTAKCVEVVERKFSYANWAYYNQTVRKWKKESKYFCKCEKPIHGHSFLANSFLSGTFCKSHSSPTITY